MQSFRLQIVNAENMRRSYCEMFSIERTAIENTRSSHHWWVTKKHTEKHFEKHIPNMIGALELHDELKHWSGHSNEEADERSFLESFRERSSLHNWNEDFCGFIRHESLNLIKTWQRVQCAQCVTVFLLEDAKRRWMEKWVAKGIEDELQKE